VKVCEKKQKNSFCGNFKCIAFKFESLIRQKNRIFSTVKMFVSVVPMGNLALLHLCNFSALVALRMYFFCVGCILRLYLPLHKLHFFDIGPKML